MKVWKKRRLFVAFALVAVVILVTSSTFFRWDNSGVNPMLRIYMNYALRRAQKSRVRILCKTDHEALLKAGREVLSQTHINEEYFNSGESPGGGNTPSLPKEVRIPQIIRDLKGGIAIHDDGYLLIPMHGAIDNWGLKIYPDYFKKPYSDYEYGDRELIPGLWYYDHRYMGNPDYDKEIDLLIEEHKGK